MEEFCPRTSGPPSHYHDQDEEFYVIEGEMTFQAGDQILKANEGFFISIPRGTVHLFRVDSDVTHIRNLYTHTEFEQAMIALGQPASTWTLSSPGIDKRLSPEQIKALFDQIGMHIVDAPDTLHL